MAIIDGKIQTVTKRPIPGVSPAISESAASPRVASGRDEKHSHAGAVVTQMGDTIVSAGLPGFRGWRWRRAWLWTHQPAGRLMSA